MVGILDDQRTFVTEPGEILGQIPKSLSKVWFKVDIEGGEGEVQRQSFK